MDHVMRKWKKLAINNNSSSSSSTSTTRDHNSKKKSIKFLKKKTLSFSSAAAAAAVSSNACACSSSSSSSSSASSDGVLVPKGSLVVCVGEEMRRFVIPTEYLCHQAFGALLREAEEEYGFEQEGVLRIPCRVAVFEQVLQAVEKEKEERGGGGGGGGWHARSSPSGMWHMQPSHIFF